MNEDVNIAELADELADDIMPPVLQILKDRGMEEDDPLLVLLNIRLRMTIYDTVRMAASPNL